MTNDERTAMDVEIILAISNMRDELPDTPEWWDVWDFLDAETSSLPASDIHIAVDLIETACAADCFPSPFPQGA